MIKKTLALVVVCVILFSLAACGIKVNPQEKNYVENTGNTGMYNGNGMTDTTPPANNSTANANGNGTSKGETYQILDLPLKIYNSTFSSGSSTIEVGSTIDTSHTLAYKNWGEDTPTTVNNVRSVYGSAFYSLFFIKDDNTLWAMGKNNRGYLGDNTGVDQNEPVKILEDVANLYLSHVSDSVFAVKSDMTLWAWGDNRNYELGTGDNEIKYAPVKVLDNVVKVLPLYDTAYASRGNTTLAIQNDGSLYAWGNEEIGTTPQKIFGGVKNVYDLNFGIVAIITGENKMYLWCGTPRRGSSMLPGATEECSAESPPIPYLPELNIICAAGDGIDWIDNNENRSILFITDDRTLWGIGSNDGFLGDGTKVPRDTPVEIMKDVAAVMCERVTLHATMVAIKQDGSVWAWSYDHVTPEKLWDNIKSCIVPDGPSNYGFYITADGKIYCFDFGVYGYGYEEEKAANVALPNFLVMND